LENRLSGLFLFFIILFSGYITEVLPCGFQKLATSNIIIKHLLSYLILFISVVLFTDQDINNRENIIKSIGISLVLYVWVIIMTKMNIYFFLLLILLLLILYILVQYKKQKTLDKTITPKDNKIIKLVNEILFISIIIITILCVLVYYGEKKYEYREKFNWSHFLFGKIVCNEKSESVSFKNYIYAIFRKY
jgi:hypothetical protein